MYEAGRNAAFVDSYVQAPPGNLLYGRTGALRHEAGLDASGLPHTGQERELFPGFALMLLALAGGWFGWRSDARPLVAAMLAVAVTGFVLSLGPDGVGSIYATLHRYVFGFQAVRASARFSVLVTFGLATLAALAWRELSSRAHRPGAFPRALAPAALAIVVLECAHLPVTLAAAPPQQTEVGQWLRGAPGSGAVAILPLGLDIDSTPAMVQSLEHRRPILNGYSGQRPAYYASLVDTLSTFPSPEALVALHESGVQYVVAPAPVERPAGETAWPLVPRAQFGTGTIYEIVWSPEIDARFSTLTTVVPPPAGTASFTAGEEAVYTVAWDGAGVNLAAGEITLSVTGPPAAGASASGDIASPASESYRFVATAATAPWVARFFEARDRFETTTDAALMPLVHTRELNEGSRHVNRTYVYDAAAGVVRIGDVALPLAAGARDAIAAIYYVRTLPLDPGGAIAFPVNEAGRNLVIEVRVGGREQVIIGGQPVAAIRLEPRIRQRVERRQQATGTLWISDDARRVPVLVEIAAGFGRVRLELARYRAGS
jgi:hypothetical protein